MKHSRFTDEQIIGILKEQGDSPENWRDDGSQVSGLGAAVCGKICYSRSETMKMVSSEK